MADGQYTRLIDEKINLFGLHQYDGLSQFFSPGTYALPQVAGWVIVCGFSAFFALVALFLVWVDVKFAGHKYNSEQFNTAGRSVKAGLIGVDVVSHFTWASILLSCVTLSYLNGISNSMWYANTGLNTFLFAMTSLELKHRAPKAHTFLEIIEVRWGFWAHMLFGFYAFMTNFIVSIMMVMGAVVITNTLTGVNAYALSMIIPLGVCLYAVTGGLKATFTTSYIHTVIIFGVCCLFMFKTYAGGGILGNMDKVYDRLVAMGTYVPVPGNKQGSYLTVWSLQGFYTDINGIIAGFVQIFADQSYWQSAVAASPAQAVKGYMVGTFLYFAIVFSLPISMGLAAIALDLPLSGDEASNGLVLPAVAIVYFGKAGAVLVVIMCFMAVTSSGAGEILAAASLFTYDVYRKYVRPKATGTELLMVSRTAVIAWGIITGLACCMCTGVDISYNFMGVVLSVFVGGAVLPIAFVLFWSGCTALGACVGTITGGCCGIVAWVVTARKMYEEASVLSLQNNEPVLAGCCCGVGIAAIVCITLSLLRPNKEKFDWSLFDHDIILSDKGERLGMTQEGVDSAEYIRKMRKYVWIASGVFFMLTQIIWPLLSLPAGAVFARPYFKLWVYIGFILIVGASLVAVILPVYEARQLCWVIITRLFRWDSPSAGLNYQGNEMSHNGNTVVGDADIDVSAGKGFGTTTSPGHAYLPHAMNDSAHGGNQANAVLKATE